MSLRLLWWAPLGVFVLFSAVLGLRFGWKAADVTETDVIETYATRYMAAQAGGARLTDCAAYPAPQWDHIWLVVACRPPDGSAPHLFHVNHLGGLEHAPTTGDDPLREPQT